MQNETNEIKPAALFKFLPSALSYAILLGMGATGAGMMVLGTGCLVIDDDFWALGSLSLIIGAVIATLATLKIARSLVATKP